MQMLVILIIIPSLTIDIDLERGVKNVNSLNSLKEKKKLYILTSIKENVLNSRPCYKQYGTLLFRHVYHFSKLIKNKCHVFCVRHCLDLSTNFAQAIFQKYHHPIKM
jgi:hypothetical protein